MSRLDELAELGCILCWYHGCPGTPAEIHHLRASQGLSQRASDDEAIPLCPEHHRGATGFHGLGARAFEKMHGVSEQALLEMTLEMVPKKGPDEPGEHHC